jgi:hypothetical protein
MSAAELYDATLIKRRRATRAEMEERAEFLNGYAEERDSVTVRSLCYQAEVAGVPGIEKDDPAYA